jgi:murein DD-endopeptidase MepM/ murein hydrolase activator NlpD
MQHNRTTYRVIASLVLCLALVSNLHAQPYDCTAINTLNNKVRDQLITKKEAMPQLLQLLPGLRTYYTAHGGKSGTTYFFPLQGYNSSAIGGKNGSGYIASGYDYFDGNKHGGHPAHDIFINDKNQDCKDDKTGKPVNVLSMSHGIVVAIETNWQPNSPQRGGNYIWVYDAGQNCFWYYAHNNTVLVKLCDIIKPGDVIATVGRTGLNAAKKRSPTHLHFMQLKIDASGYPKPVNCYRELCAAATK